MVNPVKNQNGKSNNRFDNIVFSCIINLLNLHLPKISKETSKNHRHSAQEKPFLTRFGERVCFMSVRVGVILALLGIARPSLAKEPALAPENNESQILLASSSSHSIQLGPRRLILPEYLPEGTLPEKEDPVPGIAPPPGTDEPRIMISSLLRESVTETVHEIPGGIEVRARTAMKYAGKSKIILKITISGSSETKPQNVSVASVIKGIRGEEKTGRLKRGSDTITFDLPVSRDNIDINHRIQNIPLELDVTTDDDWKISKTTTRLLVGYAEYTGWAIPSDNVNSQWAFVSPDDKNIVRIAEKAKSIVEREEAGPVRNLKAINAIFSAFRENGLKTDYDKEYKSSDSHLYIQFPSETLYFGGDCEDLSTAYISALLAAGINARFVIHKKHVFVIADVGGTVAEVAKKIGEVPLEWFFTVKNGKLISGDKDPEGHAWIPIETTVTKAVSSAYGLWHRGIFTALEAIHRYKNHQVLDSPENGKLEIEWPINQGKPNSLMSRMEIASTSDTASLQSASDTHNAFEILKIESLPGPSTSVQRRQAYLHILKLLEPDLDFNQLIAFYDETLKKKMGFYFSPKWKP